MGVVVRAILCSLMLFSCSEKRVEEERDVVKYRDPEQPLEVRVEDLLGRMTLREKVGQMAQIDRQVASPEVMRDFFIGSVLTGAPGGTAVGGDSPLYYPDPPEGWVEVLNGYQEGSLSTRLGIPMLFGIDAVHGNNDVHRATLFPHNIGLGATRDLELVRRIGAAQALETRAAGIPYTFSPCVAVCRDPRWGRCYESFSEDPEIVREMAAAIISGLQGDPPADHPWGVPFVGGNTKVAACAKHFVGDGGTVGGVDENNTVVSREELFKIHMPPYYDSVARGVSTIMVSYSSWNGIKMHTNRNLVTGFLKRKLGFKGFVISDWEGIDRITSPPKANYSNSIRAGVLAGIDMVMIPIDYITFINDLIHQVESKIVPMSRINDAVRRILRVKFTLGLFEKPYADNSFVKELGKQEHRNLAREAVRKSLVLLKNGKSESNPLLPLSKTAPKILVAGTHASNLGYQCGGWSLFWQGFSGNNQTDGTTILEAVKSAVSPSTEVVYSENPDASFVEKGNFSYAVVAVGERPYAEKQGDSSTLTVADPGGGSAIETVCAHVRCAVVVVSGRPVVIEPYLPVIDALVAAWLPGTEGRGVADVLFGDYGFSGKLPRTWFRSVDQLPMNVGDEHYDPLFPFGFGLETSPAMEEI